MRLADRIGRGLGPPAALALTVLLTAGGCRESTTGDTAFAAASNNQPAIDFLANKTTVNTGGPGLAAHRPDIRCCGANIYVVWEENRFGQSDVFFNCSTDGGRTWRRTDRRVSRHPKGSADTDVARVGIADGNVVVVWELTTPSGPDAIMSNHSTDGGKTWQSNDLRLDTDALAGGDSESPRITTTGSNVYVVWRDNRNGDEEPFLNSSSDGGVTWRAQDLRLAQKAPGQTETEQVRICADGKRVYVTWDDDKSGIYFNYSVDHGSSWSAKIIQLDPNSVGGSHRPEIACQGRNVFVAWTGDVAGSVDGYYEVLFSRSQDSGRTWLAQPIQLDTAPPVIDSQDLQIAAAGQRVYVGWKDKRNGSDDLFLNYSADGGATWMAQELRIDTDAPGAGDSDSLQLCADGLNVFLGWEDSRNGTDDLYLNYSTDGGDNWLANDLQVHASDRSQGDTLGDPALCCEGDRVWILCENEGDIVVDGGPVQ